MLILERERKIRVPRFRLPRLRPFWRPVDPRGADFPLYSQTQRIQAIGVVDDASNSRGVTLTAGATAHTKGSPVELSASTPFDARAFKILIGSISGATISTNLLDIMIGPATEKVILENLLFADGRAGFMMVSPWIPHFIAGGTRVSAKFQSNIASHTIRLQLLLKQGAFNEPRTYQRAKTYGATLADSGGLLVDPGGTAHTEGAYTELTSSLVHPVKWLMLCFGGLADGTRDTRDNLWDLAIGPATEKVIAENFFTSEGTSTDAPSFTFFEMDYDIPAGTRVAIRTKSSAAAINNREYDVTMVTLD